MSLPTIAHVLGIGRFRNFFLLFGASYALAYMFWTGMITYLWRKETLEAVGQLNPPYFWVFTDGPLGQYPALLWIPTRNWIISINLSAALFTTITSTLISLTATLIIYGYRCANSNCLRHASPGFLGSVIGFFGIFACCGGGLVITALGYAAFAFLAEWSTAITWASIGLLFLGVVLVSERLTTKLL